MRSQRNTNEKPKRKDAIDHNKKGMKKSPAVEEDRWHKPSDDKVMQDGEDQQKPGNAMKENAMNDREKVRKEKIVNKGERTLNKDNEYPDIE